jgi:hypothetical protein
LSTIAIFSIESRWPPGDGTACLGGSDLLRVTVNSIVPAAAAGRARQGREAACGKRLCLRLMQDLFQDAAVLAQPEQSIKLLIYNQYLLAPTTPDYGRLWPPPPW